MKVAASMVLIGIFISAIIPQFSVKMFALGLVSGGEGTFSALFTIYINENTAKTTKLRSSLVSICFLAYAIGCIFVNTLAYFTTNPNVITLVTAGLLIVSVLPCFCGYIETPYFLWKRGRIGDLYDALMTIYKYNQDKYGMDPTLQLGVQSKLMEYLGISSHVTQRTFFQQHAFYLKKTRIKDAPSSNSIVRLFKTKKYLHHLVALVFLGGLLYCLFFGLSINIQDLGLKDVKLNGILLGATQGLGYLGVAPFTHKMKRRTWFMNFQFVILFGAIALFFLSVIPQTSKVQLAQSFTSTLVMATSTSAMFPLFFLYISEVFPTEIRGSANAIVLFMAKLTGCLSPILEEISMKLSIHVLVGCSILVVPSLILCSKIKETLT